MAYKDQEKKKIYCKKWKDEWKKNNPEKARSQARERELRRKFGINLEQYNEILKKQNYKCAICNKKETMIIKGKIVELAVDHNHDDGKIRGLLCSNCNNGLGRFFDNKELLLKAYDYLKK
jgi:hypothetical protein